jgi:hypothetical protein
MGIGSRIKFLVRMKFNEISRKVNRAIDALKEPDESIEAEKNQIDIDKEWEELIKDVGWKRTVQNTDPELSRLTLSYKILKLEFGAPLDQVTARLKELVKKNHPDLFPDPEKKKRADEYVGEVTQAFNKIKDYWDNKKKRGF